MCICRGGVRGKEHPGFLTFDPQLNCVNKHLLPCGGVQAGRGRKGSPASPQSTAGRSLHLKTCYILTPPALAEHAFLSWGLSLWKRNVGSSAGCEAVISSFIFQFQFRSGPASFLLAPVPRAVEKLLRGSCPASVLLLVWVLLEVRQGQNPVKMLASHRFGLPSLWVWGPSVILGWTVGCTVAVRGHQNRRSTPTWPEPTPRPFLVQMFTKGGFPVWHPVLPCLTFDPELNCVCKCLLPHGGVQAGRGHKGSPLQNAGEKTQIAVFRVL